MSANNVPEIKVPSIGTVTSNISDIVRAVKAEKEILEVREGIRGPAPHYDAFVRYRDLIEYLSTDAETVASLSSADHNSLSNLQGGTVDEYYHLLLAEYTELTEWLDDVTLGSDGQTTIPQLVLSPREAALNNVKGGMYFSSLDDSVYVCTSAE